MTAALLVALALDTAIGWPDRLFARIGHPVTWIGRLIDALDRRLNRAADPPARRRLMGRVTVAAVLFAAILPAYLLERALGEGALAPLLLGALAWPFLAARSLHDHVAAVARPLGRGDIAAARSAVARIVGRDPDRLDAAGIARAAIESLAENASDGVVAPLVWGLALGLPGLAGYKAINTMDSMIGHRTPRHQEFGHAAARLDDLVNLVPARLTGTFIALVAPAPRTALALMRRDAPRHRSPNAGWPEAAMAAALGRRLSGPRLYAEGFADEPWLNAGAPDPGATDIARALSFCRRALVVLAGGLLALAWL